MAHVWMLMAGNFKRGDMKELCKRCVLLVMTSMACFFASSCSDWFLEEPVYNIPSFSATSGFPIEVENDAISQEAYEKLCIRTEYYFCPGVSGPMMRIEITKDICENPPVVLSMSECEEYLECDPHHYNLGEKSCIAADGMPGSYESFCVKGFVEEGPCVSFPMIDNLEAEDVTVEDSDLTTKEICEYGPNDFVDSCENEEVDVLVIVDLSASMLPEIQSVYSLVKAFSEDHEDADHIKWSLIVGPKNSGNKPGNHNFLYLASNLQSIHDFQSALEQVLTYDMIGQYEMLYDALYLSLRNIASFLPYQWDELLWPVWIGNVIDESIPPIEDFYVNWRENSKKIVVVFTDEPGQSFLIPASEVGKTYNTNNTVTQEKLSMMLESIENIKLYTFTEDYGENVAGAWQPLSSITGGESFELSANPGDTLDHLIEILEGEVCY